jgi:hypothetical protein
MLCVLLPLDLAIHMGLAGNSPTDIILVSLIFSRMASNLVIKIRNMPPLQDTTIARLHQVMGLALPPTITPKTIWKSYHNNKRNLLDYFSYCTYLLVDSAFFR